MKKKPINAQAFVKQQHDQMVAAVLAQFTPYGRPTCLAIRQAVTQSNGLAKMIQKLGMAPPNSFEYQVKTIIAFLKENGAANFLRLIGAGAEAMPAKMPAQPAPSQAEAPAPAPQPVSAETAPASPPGVTPAGHFDAQGRYIGPERRSGVERRSGYERRDKVEMIRSNKRYGGDRRKAIRRRADRELAARLGLLPRQFPPPPDQRKP